MFMRAGAYALASKRRRAEDMAAEYNNSDDENYVEPEKRNYLYRHWLKMRRMKRNKANLL